jgi:hypothetical protein
MRETYKVQFRLLGKDEWKTLEVFGSSFTNMEHAIQYIRSTYNYTKSITLMNLKLESYNQGTKEWDNF